MNNFDTATPNPLSGKTKRRASPWVGVLPALLLSLPLLGLAAEQKTFATPEAAVDALIETCKGDDDAAFIPIFGETHKGLILSQDRAETRATLQKGCAALQAFHLLDESANDRRILLMGEQAWPMPIPLVRENGVWRFATELGQEEIITRRIGRNERNAIDVLHAYLNAQRQYAAVDRNGDDVLEYAQKLASTPGSQDGLYWAADVAKGEESSPFGPLIAASSEYLTGRKAADPFRGYHFRILTRQGRSAPGGAFSYLINGRMIAGFAMIAYPAEYGKGGVMTFIVSNAGIIYERNLGPKTAKAARLIREFDPDVAWKRVEAPF